MSEYPPPDTNPQQINPQRNDAPPPSGTPVQIQQQPQQNASYPPPQSSPVQLMQQPNVQYHTKLIDTSQAPVLNTWKTSVGFSVLGALLRLLLAVLLIALAWPLMSPLTLPLISDLQAMLSWLPLDLSFNVTACFSLVAALCIIYLFGIVYAAIIYPSYFKIKPIIKTSRAISLMNIMFGSVVIGALWNRNLTRGVRGISHLVSITFMALTLACSPLIASSLASAVTTNAVVQSIESQTSISIFLHDEADQNDVDALRGSIESMPEVATVTYVDKEQALENFKEMTSPEIADQLTGNPLPASLEIELNDPRKVQVVVDSIVSNPISARVIDNPGDPEDSIRYGQQIVRQLFAVHSIIWMICALPFVLAALVWMIIFLVRRSRVHRKR